MKTIGRCENCNNWRDSIPVDSDIRKPVSVGKCKISDDKISLGDWALSKFGCIYWEDNHNPHPDYPAKSVQDLRIEDLERENDAAFIKIQELSRALAAQGIDPTQLP